MATLRDIQRRIRAVKSTRQITKAMKMVAAAKLRKSQQRMLELRPYADKMSTIIGSLVKGVEREAHPLLAVRPRKNVEVIVFTSDRGLCGAFNSNILKASVSLVREYRGENPDNKISGEELDVSLNIVGKKANDYFKRRKEFNIRKRWTGISGKIVFTNAQEIAKDVIESYVNEQTDEVYVIYNEFKNVAQQIVRVSRLLPATSEEEAEGAQQDSKVDFIYEPSEEILLDRLLPKNVEIQIYRALLESQASEEAARMTAMENASKSATEMIDKLTLQYNKARQASITAELMDIVGGVEALKKG